jgi:TPR repeat protein
MLRLRLLLLLLAIASTQAAHAADTESLLRQQLQQALWPAEIVRLADQYLSRFPDGPANAEAINARSQAQQAQRVLSRNDVRLYRSAFQPAGDSRVQDELRRAALADREAAVRIAHWHQRGEQGVASDQNRYVGWLQYAAMLGDQRASYELALHYRRDSQPVLAAQYEARAVELGFTPPRDLDHVRK